MTALYPIEYQWIPTFASTESIMDRHGALKSWAWLVLALIATGVHAAVDLSSFSVDPPGLASNELFLFVGTQGVPASPHDLGAAKAWPVKINLAYLVSLPPDIVVNFPDREFAHLHRTRSEDRGPGAFLWVGEGNGCAGLFSAIPNSFRAILACGNGPYGVDKVPHGEDLQLTWYDQSQVPPVDDGPANLELKVQPGESLVLSSQNGADTEIDILVLYTEGVRAVLDPNGGEQNSRQYAQDLVNLTQQAMTRSTGASQSLIAGVNLVHAQKALRADTGNYVEDLLYLKNDPEPSGLRDYWGADVVMYLTVAGASPNSCGLSNEPASGGMPPAGPDFAPFAQAVVRMGCAISAYAFQHELGHIFGANHNVESIVSLNPVEPYAYGHWHADIEAGYRTVMSTVSSGCKPSCFQVLNYSNPLVTTDDGFVTGSANHNNAAVIAEFAPATAQYRASLGRIFMSGFE